MKRVSVPSVLWERALVTSGLSDQELRHVLVKAIEAYAEPPRPRGRRHRKAAMIKRDRELGLL